MRNYIILNGKNSNEINGLLIQELPPISKPLIRTEVEEIDGRDGDIVTPLGYSAYDKEFTIGLYKDFDVNEVAAYFNSEGTVIFSNEPDKYYYYQITAQIDFERLVRYRTATVTMHCQPFKYSATEQAITEDVSGTVSDEGTNLALENTAEAPFNTLDLKGNTSQQTYTGKNLLPVRLQLGNQGITASYDANSGMITVGGTPTVEYPQLTITYSLPTPISSGTVLDFSAYQFPSNVRNIYIRLYGESGDTHTDYSLTPSTASRAFTLSSDVYRIMLILRCTVGTAISGSFGLQLEAASSATSFEPYVGGIPAPNPDYPQAVQTVTGENVVKITGKNLYDGSISETGKRLSTSTGGSYTDANYDISSYIPVQPNTTYTINTQGRIFCDEYTDSRVFITGHAQSYGVTDPITITTASTARYIRFDFPTGNASVSMLELGSSASSFEPYQGQSYEVNFTPNLYDLDNRKKNYYLNNSGAEVQNNQWSITDYIPVAAGETYYYSGITNAGNAPYSAFYDSNKGYVSSFKQATGGNYLKIPSGVAYVRISLNGIDGDTTSDSYKFVFTEYSSRIELCKIGDYQDYIYKSDGKWYVHKAINKEVLDGSGTWTAGGQNGAYIWRAPASDLVMPSAASVLADIVCSHLKVVTFPDIYYARDTGIAIPGNSQRICISTMTDVATTKAWLDANTPSVYYVLATPTDTEITNEALIEQLDDIYYHAHSYKGRTHITSSAATGNVPHIIAAEVGEDNESTITNAGNYLSKPKITVYGSGDISLYINDMHVLQITLGDEGYITIDTAQMEAYKDTLDNLKNRLVIGDYSNARLKPGANKIHFTGTVTKYVVENYSRWL